MCIGPRSLSSMRLGGIIELPVACLIMRSSDFSPYSDYWYCSSTKTKSDFGSL